MVCHRSRDQSSSRYIGFKGKPDEGKTVEVGYGIIPSAQNKGFATEAVKGLIDWAFSTGEVEKVMAECLEDNVPSIKVLKKLGMHKKSAKNGIIYWEISRDY
nr:GNAT family N-acetyltransferase [Neobacillus sp. Marseille-Q6967]